MLQKANQHQEYILMHLVLKSLLREKWIGKEDSGWKFLLPHSISAQRAFGHKYSFFFEKIAMGSDAKKLSRYSVMDLEAFAY